MPIAMNDETGEVRYLDPDGSWKPAKTAVNPDTGEKLAYDGSEWKAVQKSANKGALGYLDDAARAVAQGVTFGYADEIGAAVNPAINRALGMDAPETYEAALQQERARYEQIPGAIKYPGEIAGAVGSTVLAAPAVAAGAARAGLTALPRTAQFAGLGAAEGALAGSGQATEGNRLQGAATGAAIGLPVGGAAPHVARGAANVAGRVKGAFSPQANVAADLGRAVLRDEDTPEALMRRAVQAHQQRPGVATIADVGGENVRGLVERVAQTPGAGRTTVVPRLTQRQQQQALRIGRDLKTLTGTGRSAYEAVTDTMKRRSLESRPLYQAAYREGEGGLMSPELERLMSSDAVAKAMKSAVTRGRNRAVSEGFGEFNPRVRFNEAGDVEFVRGADGRTVFPDLRLWDYTKRELDDMAGAAGRSGRTDEAGVFRSLARQLREELDTMAPTYQQARNTWSGHASYLDAIEQGRDVLSRRMSAEEMRGTFNAMGGAEKDAYRIGAVSSIIARMGNDASKMGDMTKYLRSPEMRAKIAAIMPTQEAADAWLRRLDFEVGASELTGRSLGNSATARRLAEQRDAQNLAGDLVMDALAGAGQVSLLRRIVGAGPRWLRDTLRSRADKRLAEVLTGPVPAQDLPSILQGMQRSTRPPSGVASAATTAAGVTGLIP